MTAGQPTHTPRTPQPQGYRESRAFPWPDWDEGPWQIELDFAEDSETGRIFCCGVAVRLRDGAEPIEMTATLLREVPLGALVRWHMKESALWANRLDEMSTLGSDTFAELRAGYRAGVSGPRGGRPPKYGAEHYERVAEVYKAAYKGGAPTKAVAEHPEWGPIGRSCAKKWISTARKLGYLGETVEGRAGGLVVHGTGAAYGMVIATATGTAVDPTKPTRKPAVRKSTSKTRKPTKKKGTR